MTKLSNSLRDWQTDAFNNTLQSELEALRGNVLPLAEVIGEGNTVLDSDLGVTVIAVEDGEGVIQAHVGVYFAEIVSCCSCGESPPIDEAYCEMGVIIDKSTAEASFKVI
jgi:hypothetical protein